MIDTHAHLDACAEAPDTLLERAREQGVSRVITIGTGIDSSRAAIALVEATPGVFASLGIHPHDAGGEQAERVAELRDLLTHDRAVAVGETGLDYFRDHAPRDAQRRLFEQQLELAADLGLPVVVHSRAASDDTADVLAGFSGTVVLHCFSEPGLLSTALDRDYYVSFAGNVTYRNAEALRQSAALVSEDRLLAETDCPYLAPQPVRGQRCEPAFVVHTLAVLAAVRGIATPELEVRIDANADRAFSIP